METKINCRFWYKASHFEILSVHDLLQAPRNSGRDNAAGIIIVDEVALLSFYRFSHCTKLPRALLLMFFHGAVE